MTKLLQMAVEAVRQLRPAKQDQAARAIWDVVNGAEEDLYVLSEEENAAVDRGLAELERGEFATEKELRAVLTNYRQ